MNHERQLAERTDRMSASAIRELLKVANRPGMISLAGGIPSLEALSLSHFRDLTAAALDRHGHSALQYSPSEGLPLLREMLAEKLVGQGLQVLLDQVLVTSGPQGALDTIGKLLIARGDKVVVENPTYLGALQAFNPYEPDYLVPLALIAATAGWADAQGFTLSSPQLKEGASIAAEQVYSGIGCNGGNISPELDWKNAPEGTKSFAVTVYDPDAPTGSGWWHWVIFNIPAEAHGLPRNAGGPQAYLAPVGSVQSRTDFGPPGYGGPCPPPGAPHRYILTIFALDVDRFDLRAQTSPAKVGFHLNAHKLATAELTATYGR